MSLISYDSKPPTETEKKQTVSQPADKRQVDKYALEPLMRNVFVTLVCLTDSIILWIFSTRSHLAVNCIDWNEGAHVNGVLSSPSHESRWNKKVKWQNEMRKIKPHKLDDTSEVATASKFISNQRFILSTQVGLFSKCRTFSENFSVCIFFFFHSWRFRQHIVRATVAWRTLLNAEHSGFY